jgi:hypothetical protein
MLIMMLTLVHIVVVCLDAMKPDTKLPKLIVQERHLVFQLLESNLKTILLSSTSGMMCTLLKISLVYV